MSVADPRSPEAHRLGPRKTHGRHPSFTRRPGSQSPASYAELVRELMLASGERVAFAGG